MDGLRSAEWAGGSNDALILQYGNLVRCIAHQLVRRMPRSIEVEDLVQSGMIGLLEAARRYDDIKGFSFVSFATPRIRGAMLDAHRLSDWSPRSLRRRQRAIKRASTEIEMKTGARRLVRRLRRADRWSVRPVGAARTRAAVPHHRSGDRQIVRVGAPGILVVLRRRIPDAGNRGETRSQ
jgi:RNA polymerase sigma factor (sigma-70 family)